MSEQLDLLYEIHDLLTRQQAAGNKQQAIERLARVIKIQERLEGAEVERPKCRHDLPVGCCRLCWADRKKREACKKRNDEREKSAP